MTIKDIYNSVARYNITSDVQEIPFQFDYDLLLKELLDFIERNNYGHFVTSLKLDHETTNLSEYNKITEVLQFNAKGTANWYYANSAIIDERDNHNFKYWHPDLVNSYVRVLADRLEELTGFKIGRIRLGWLLPDCGYSMHADTEALRFHIPLITNDWAYFLINNQIHHMDKGKLYHLQTTEHHSAFNLGPIPRLHLIFSTCTWPELDHAVEQAVNSTKLSTDIISQLEQDGCTKHTLNQLANIFDQNNTSASSQYSSMFRALSEKIK